MIPSMIPLPTGDPPIVERPPLPIGDPPNDQRPLRPKDPALPVGDPRIQDRRCTFSFNCLNPNLISVHPINFPTTPASALVSPDQHIDQPNPVAVLSEEQLPPTTVDSSVGTNMYCSEDKLSLSGSSSKRALDFEEVSASFVKRGKLLRG